MINELLDGLDQIAFWQDEEGRQMKAFDSVVHRQTLHPFGKENYEGERLPRSFSLPNLKASGSVRPREKNRSFCIRLPANSNSR